MRNVRELCFAGEDLGQSGGLLRSKPLIESSTGVGEPDEERPPSLLTDFRRGVQDGTSQLCVVIDHKGDDPGIGRKLRGRGQPTISLGRHGFKLTWFGLEFPFGSGRHLRHPGIETSLPP